MDKKTKGAWILHHTQKLQTTTSQDFDAIAFAGKCGSLLSAISAANQSQIPRARLDAMARANNISPKTEVPAILDELARQKLIDRGTGAVEVLGITSSSLLEHTSTIFDEAEHERYEDAVLDISDAASEAPLTDRQAIAKISDEFQLPSANAASVVQLASGIGFFDSEPVSDRECLLFNGNLNRPGFRGGSFD